MTVCWRAPYEFCGQPRWWIAPARLSPAARRQGQANETSEVLYRCGETWDRINRNHRFSPKLLHPSFRMLSALISLPRRQSKNNEDDAKPPSLFGGRMFVSYLGRNHRYDSHRAGIHNNNLITDQDIFVAAILRGILHDRNRESIAMNCSRNSLTNRD